MKTEKEVRDMLSRVYAECKEYAYLSLVDNCSIDDVRRSDGYLHFVASRAALVVLEEVLK